MYFSCKLHFASFFIFFVITVIISCSMILLLSYLLLAIFVPYLLITVCYLVEKRIQIKAEKQWKFMLYKRRISYWLAN